MATADGPVKRRSAARNAEGLRKGDDRLGLSLECNLSIIVELRR